MRFSFLPLLLVLLAAPLAAQTTHTVVVQNFEFSPATLTVEAGDTVRWTNAGGAHNVHSLAGPQSFTSGAVAGGNWEFSFTFTDTGTNTYQCDAHSGVMQGSVTVTQNTSTEEPHAIETDALRHDGPNPFHETARLVLQLRESQDARVAVFDAVGREVAVLLEGTVPGGETNLTWAPANDQVGVFVVRAVGPALDSSLGIVRLGTHTGGH